MGLKLLASLKKSPLGAVPALGIVALALALILGLHWPLVAVLGSVGVGSVLLAWWRLK
jgi:chromate transporter